MTREEAITVFEAFINNPLFSDVHKAAFNIAIHDIKQRHDWDINNLILINKDNYEPLEQESNKSEIPTGSIIDWNNCHTTEQLGSIATPKNDLGVDCISRAEAIKCLECDFDITGKENMKTVVNYINLAHDKIVNLPRVKQEPKTGHWIDIMVGDMPAQACDQCNTFYPLAYTGGGHKYCPNCGAKMVEPQERSE